ncbi:hypothetical protein SAMN06296020_10164 [Anoxynatronum buryatiense]|uniref:Uncharacterized protein n=1 Tax=Anoxynatronum buryatiense TaxID=489973 RepID=A0AA46AH98_9CLOT|nr:hypothetical protein SAMN06296020_10164 [Anoxynatronum buryatiense]
MTQTWHLFLANMYSKQNDSLLIAFKLKSSQTIHSKRLILCLLNILTLPLLVKQKFS